MTDKYKIEPTAYWIDSDKIPKQSGIFVANPQQIHLNIVWSNHLHVVYDESPEFCIFSQCQQCLQLRQVTTKWEYCADISFTSFGDLINLESESANSPKRSLHFTPFQEWVIEIKKNTEIFQMTNYWDIYQDLGGKGWNQLQIIQHLIIAH